MSQLLALLIRRNRWQGLLAASMWCVRSTVNVFVFAALLVLPPPTSAQPDPDRVEHIKNCVTRDPGLKRYTRPGSKSTHTQVGPLVLDGKRDPRATLVASFVFSDRSVEPDKMQVVFATSRTPGSAGCVFRFELTNNKGRMLAIYGIPNPRRIFIDDPKDKIALQQQKLVDVATYVARFPLTPEASEIKVLDSNANPLASVKVASQVKEFCDKYPNTCKVPGN